MRRTIAVLLAVPLLAGCGGGSPAQARGTGFDGPRAFAFLKRQVELGPRPAGSAASRRLAGMLRRRLPHGRFEAVPGGLRNVVGELPGRGPAILLAAHYDTKDTPAGFLGAEDGAGGTAELLEVARQLRHDHRPRAARAIRFALFDGEECPGPGDGGNFTDCGDRGSTAYAARHWRSIGAMVLLDFVAQRHLAIPREASSDPRLWARLRRAARRAGRSWAFPAAEQGTVLDDHTPFERRGIRAIDLIDFDFPCWHKLCDDLSAVSERSLDASGEAVLGLMRDLRRSGA